MLSLPKILLTVAVIAAVYLISKSLSARARRAGETARSTPPPPDSIESLDLAPCPVCGAYREKGATCCER